ncbi:MAG: tetratricopeptide repeat protein [Paramuribaculum sp.]|nr:tetratricopeptide repeat protein [Paramuribaculum sp.]
MSSLPNNIEHLIQSGQIDEAIAMLDRYIASNLDDAEALYLRGKAWWKRGDRSRATGDYTASALIDPAGKGARALEMAHDVADFFNPDLLNP